MPSIAMYSDTAASSTSADDVGGLQPIPSLLRVTRGEKNGGCRLPAVLGQSAPLGRPASKLGMPERRNSESIRSRTELRTDVSMGVSVTSNHAGARSVGIGVGQVMQNGSDSGRGM